jgi:hypothetical protein
MGMPGCPELAFSTLSTESIRIVLIHNSSNFNIIFPAYAPFRRLNIDRLQQ